MCRSASAYGNSVEDTGNCSSHGEMGAHTVSAHALISAWSWHLNHSEYAPQQPYALKLGSRTDDMGHWEPVWASHASESNKAVFLPEQVWSKPRWFCISVGNEGCGHLLVQIGKTCWLPSIPYRHPHTARNEIEICAINVMFFRTRYIS